MTMTGLSSFAKNAIATYKGADLGIVKLMLTMSSDSVFNELKSHFGATGVDDLAAKMVNNK